MRETTESQYGIYETTVIGLGGYQKHRCQFDDELENNTERYAVFYCKNVNGTLTIVPVYNCLNTAKTDRIRDLASNVST